MCFFIVLIIEHGDLNAPRRLGPRPKFGAQDTTRRDWLEGGRDLEKQPVPPSPTHLPSSSLANRENGINGPAATHKHTLAAAAEGWSWPSSGLKKGVSQIAAHRNIQMCPGYDTQCSLIIVRSDSLIWMADYI